MDAADWILYSQAGMLEGQLHAFVVHDKCLAVVVVAHDGDAVFIDSGFAQVSDRARNVDEDVTFCKDKVKIGRLGAGEFFCPENHVEPQEATGNGMRHAEFTADKVAQKTFHAARPSSVNKGVADGAFPHAKRNRIHQDVTNEHLGRGSE